MTTMDVDAAGGGPANDLATRLFGLDLPGTTTAAVTRHITDVVVRWALDNGWTPTVEARVEALESRLRRAAAVGDESSDGR